MNTLVDGIQSLFSMSIHDEEAIIAALDNLVKDFGADEVQRCYVRKSKSKDLLIHELVLLGLPKTIEHAANELNFDINVKRESDGNTPIHLAYWYRKTHIAELLKKLQADMTIVNNYGESVYDSELRSQKGLNIVWLDLGEIYQWSVGVHRIRLFAIQFFRAFKRVFKKFCLLG